MTTPVRAACLAAMLSFELGTFVTYRGRPHVVVGVTPMSVTPRTVELEDVESGRIRHVDRTDRDLQIGTTGDTGSQADFEEE